MPKILANLQTGEQALFELSNGGRINEPVDIVWDEFVDGQMPGGVIVGKMERQGSSLVQLEDYIAAHVDVVLPKMKIDKSASLVSSYESEIYADISHDSKTWAADKKAQETLVQVLAVGSVPEGMYWRDTTGTSNPMTYSDLQSLAATILARGLAADTNLAAKLTAVNDAVSLDEVNAIEY